MPAQPFAALNSKAESKLSKGRLKRGSSSVLVWMKYKTRTKFDGKVVREDKSRKRNTLRTVRIPYINNDLSRKEKQV